MNKDQDIEKLFRDTFQDFKVSPPLDLKTKIDGTIAALEKKRKRRFFILFFIFFGICLLGISMIGLKLNESENSLSKNEKREEINTNSRNSIKSNENNTSKSKLKTLQVGTEKTKDLNPTFNQNKSSVKIVSDKTQKNTIKKLAKSSLQQKKNRKSRKNQQFKELVPLPPDKNQKNDFIDEYKNREKIELAEEKKDKKTDSIIEKVVSKDTANSIALNKNEDPLKMDKKPDSKKSKYLFSLRTGTGVARNSFEYNDSNSVNEKKLFQIQFDGVYNIFRLSPKTSLGLSSGINFNSHKEDFSRTKRITTNTFVGYDSTIIFYDSLVFQVDSAGAIIDSSTITLSKYEVNSIYEDITSLKNENLSYNIFSFSLPFQFSISQQFGQKFYADIMAGGVVSYQSVKFNKEANPLISELDYSKFGLKLCLRTQLRYQFSKFGVSLNSNFIHDFSSIKNPTNPRKRQLIDLGFGLHYAF